VSEFEREQARGDSHMSSGVKKSTALVEAEKKTVERFERREEQKTKRGATFIVRAEGMAFCEKLLPDLAEFMLSRTAPAPPKGGLSVAIRELAPEELALVALSPLLHEIALGRKKEDKSSAMKLKLTMGRTLHDKCLMKGLLKQNRRAYKKVTKAENRHLAVLKYREPRWSDEQYVRAGNWLLDCVLHRFDGYFVLDQDGFPCVTKEGEALALQLLAELVYRSPVFLPATEPLRDWTDWRNGGYWNDGTRISATFVRDEHPATGIAIRRAFRDGSMKEHVDGVNALQRVTWAINTAMLPVVERFAGEVGKKVSKPLVAQDIATAKYIGEKEFYVPMNCDFRGRVYGIPHFNFQREDHVRALFQFARGVPIGQSGDVNWIARHVATCGNLDSIGKRTMDARMDWIDANSDMIMRTAQDPEATVDWWRNADAPFSFVAGCMELAGAWKTGSSYITHLPICFDGSCSGVQHLAMMMRDEDAGRLVNLIPDGVSPEVYQSITDGTDAWLEMDLVPTDPPQDVYQLITDHVIKRLKESSDARAGWWLRRGVDRKLVKRSAMTFAYSVSLNGMQEHLDQIEDGGDTFFLAQHIMRACEETLRRPAQAMEFICKLTKECADKGKILEWTTPTGLPWANRYHKSKVKIVHLELRGERVRHKVADGYEPSLLKKKSTNSAAPNFVHALDASHLINVVNSAASEGITSIAVVHDSFGCLAPQAHKLHLIIRREMAKLYSSRDVLADLRAAAGSSEPLPAKGELSPWDVQYSTYAFA
jgi:DNA-directed RNA polymerase, mitochondrial